MESPKALIITGDGINCERETAQAFDIVGFHSEIRHLNDLIRDSLNQDRLMREYSVVALPGGFSFGDDLASGKVLALKIAHGLKWDFESYAAKGGLVIGICNGFQALIRMGVFGKSVSITRNDSGKFINKWVKVAPNGNKCVWLNGLGTVDLPVRHGEGKISVESHARVEVLTKLARQGMDCLKYEGESNPNGSVEDLAGLCDSTGRILGLMPHPEAFVRWTAHPQWTWDAESAGSPGDGLTFFENAFNEARVSR